MLFTPMSEFVRSRSESKVLIECRPTTPDVNVTLEAVCISSIGNLGLWSPCIWYNLLLTYHKIAFRENDNE